MKITTKTKSIVNAALFEVEVGTTGLRGGDSGHGGRSYLRFKDQASSDFKISVVSSGESGNGEVVLTFGGDAELENLIEALQFALDVLKESKEDGTESDLPEINSRVVE
jgi:hypothetical protein